MLILTPDQIEIATALLQQGKLVAFPTETVYGLGAAVSQHRAIRTIFKVKGRPQENPLILHIAQLSQVEQIATNIPPLFYSLAEAFFPGPLTIVLEKHPSVDPSICAGLESVAFRMPSHKIAVELIEKLGEPIAAPSANISGKPSSTDAEHVIDDFQEEIAAVIDGGPSDYGIESTVISLLDNNPTLLRLGAIPLETIEKIAGRTIPIIEGSHASPGTRYPHYQPNASVKLFYEQESLDHYLRSRKARSATILSTSNEIRSALFLNNYNLYRLLRDADKVGSKEILIFLDKNLKQDPALIDKLNRAAMPRSCSAKSVKDRSS